MPKKRKFTAFVNFGALALLLAAMVALAFSQRAPAVGERGPASEALLNKH